MVERRIKAAKFPTVKSLDSFDFAAFPSLNKALVMELARSEYVERRENIIAVVDSALSAVHDAARRRTRSMPLRVLDRLPVHPWCPLIAHHVQCLVPDSR